MKIAGIEGTADEIKDFFQDNGLKAADFFETPEPPIKTFWLVLPAVCVFVTLAVLILTSSLTPQLQKLVFVAACFFSIWWSVVLQVRFKNAWATGIAALGCLLLALVALGVVTPGQMLEEVKSIKE